MKKVIYRRAAGALLLSAGLCAAGIAGAVDTVTSLTFDGMGNSGFDIQHAAAGGYTDEFLFAVDPESMDWATGTAVVGKTVFNPGRMDNYGINDISFFKVNSDSSHTALTTVFSPGSSMVFYPSDVLAAGSYGFDVTGHTTLPAIGGSYAGNLNLVAAPVPEPASYAMLLVGLGLLGFTSRRQRNDKLG